VVSIISAGIAPGFALLSYFYLRDDYGKEPLKEVLRVFLLGAILVFPIMFIQYVIDVEQVLPNDFLRTVISFGFLEEFFKWFFLFYTVYKFMDFDEHYDGIVYGVSISLGFATVENILYLFSYGLEYAIGRAFFPVSSHAIFGVIMGYYFGKAKLTRNGDQDYWLFLSFFIPFMLHAMYDFILQFDRYWFYITVPFMIFLWWIAMRKVKKAKHVLNHSQERNITY